LLLLLLLQLLLLSEVLPLRIRSVLCCGVLCVLLQ
jgi:hypothetical protein